MSTMHTSVKELTSNQVINSDKNKLILFSSEDKLVKLKLKADKPIIQT